MKVAELAASKGHFTAVNIIWMEYIIAGREKEANDLWNKWLINAPAVMFRRLLQECHVKNDTKTVENLISTLKTNGSLTKGPIGNVYSRLIGMHLTNNKVSEAEAVLRKAIEDGVGSEHINTTTINKLKAAVVESGREFNYFK